MRIVLDTNALISSLSERLNFDIISDSLVNGGYELFLTNDILLEYETKITDFFDKH
jgi:rRNA-processing protein FCF1